MPAKTYGGLRTSAPDFCEAQSHPESKTLRFRMDALQELQSATAGLKISDGNTQRTRKSSLKLSADDTSSNTKATKRVQFSEKLAEYRPILTRWESLHECITLKPSQKASLPEYEPAPFLVQRTTPDTPPPWHIEHIEGNVGRGELSSRSTPQERVCLEYDITKSKASAMLQKSSRGTRQLNPTTHGSRLARSRQPTSNRTERLQRLLKSVQVRTMSGHKILLSRSSPSNPVLIRQWHSFQWRLKTTNERNVHRMSALRVRRISRQWYKAVACSQYPTSRDVWRSRTRYDVAPLKYYTISCRPEVLRRPVKPFTQPLLVPCATQPPDVNGMNTHASNEALRPRTYTDHVRDVRRPAALARVRA